MPDERAPEIPQAGGLVTSSKIPRIEMIPAEPIIRLAQRFELGEERKGKDKSWNALSQNQQCLLDTDFILVRMGHIIYHCLKLQVKILMRKPLLDDDDDAGAIIWGGAFLCSATRAIADRDAAAKVAPNCSACGGTGYMHPTALPGELSEEEFRKTCPACRGTGNSKLKP